MTVFALDELDVPELENVLVWDAVEAEWRVGHARRLIEGEGPYVCACTVAEGHDLVTDGEPVPVFAKASHWSRLPKQPEDVAGGGSK